MRDALSHTDPIAAVRCLATATGLSAELIDLLGTDQTSFAQIASFAIPRTAKPIFDALPTRPGPLTPHPGRYEHLFDNAVIGIREAAERGRDAGIAITAIGAGSHGLGVDLVLHRALTIHGQRPISLEGVDPAATAELERQGLIEERYGAWFPTGDFKFGSYVSAQPPRPKTPVTTRVVDW